MVSATKVLGRMAGARFTPPTPDTLYLVHRQGVGTSDAAWVSAADVMDTAPLDALDAALASGALVCCEIVCS